MITLTLLAICAACLISICMPIRRKETREERAARLNSQYNVAENWKKASKVNETNKWGDPIEEVKTGWDLFKEN